MRKLYIILFSLLIFHLPRTIGSASKNDCYFTETVHLAHNNLKKLIQTEMLHVPDSIDDKERLKEIWYQGGQRNKIQKIISKKNILKKQDLLELRFLVSQEKKWSKIKLKR